MDAEALTTKLTDAALHREDTPTEEDMLEDYKSAAYRFHDTLVQLGGRPTRNVLEKLAGRVIYGENEIRIIYEHGQLQWTLNPEANLTVHHWQTEYTRFQEELDRWKEFQKYQHTKEQEPLSRIRFEPRNTDPRLAKILVRLNDWREYQHYQLRVKVGRALMSVWRSTREMKSILDETGITFEAYSNSVMQYPLEDYFQHEQVSSRQTRLETSQIQLTWIESQITEILAEACTSLATVYPLQEQLETKLEQQANAFAQELNNLEARPIPPMQTPHKFVGLAQRIYHWGSEITRLMHEHEEWKIFLNWQKSHPDTENSANRRGLKSSGHLSGLQIWKDYASYRRYQLKRARDWLASWQRLLSLEENRIDTYPREHLFVLESTISEMRANVDKFKQDVRIAELRVRSAEQRLAELPSQRLSTDPIQTAQPRHGHPKLPLMPPEAESTTNVPELSECALLKSSPVDVDRTRRSTKSLSSEITGLVRPSHAPNKEREIQARESTISKEQQVIVPYPVIADDATQIIEGPEHSCSDEAIGDVEGGGFINTSINDAEDILMADVKDPISIGADIKSSVHSKGRYFRDSKNAGLPIDEVPTSRKTRSARKLDRTISSRILKTGGKKPSRKVKAFSDQQTMALLSATSVTGSRAESQPLRRSQRLREKTAAPLFT